MPRKTSFTHSNKKTNESLSIRYEMLSGGEANKHFFQKLRWFRNHQAGIEHILVAIDFASRVMNDWLGHLLTSQAFNAMI